MRKALFTEHNIIAVEKSVESGRIVKDIFRETGILEASYLRNVMLSITCAIYS